MVTGPFRPEYGSGPYSGGGCLHAALTCAVVDGAPFFWLGAQVGNSSGWPERLQQLWPLAAAMHVNTLEVPIYWEQMEPREDAFDDSAVDAVLALAREHHVPLMLLWFGRWKNGTMHYVPAWIKQDTARFPRMITADGKPIHVISANSPANLDADRIAFVLRGAVSCKLRWIGSFTDAPAVLNFVNSHNAK